MALTFHDEGPYHRETSPLICCSNQWTGFYMIGTSDMNELNIYLSVTGKAEFPIQVFREYLIV